MQAAFFTYFFFHATKVLFEMPFSSLDVFPHPLRLSVDFTGSGFLELRGSRNFFGISIYFSVILLNSTEFRTQNSAEFHGIPRNSGGKTTQNFGRNASNKYKLIRKIYSTLFAAVDITTFGYMSSVRVHVHLHARVHVNVHIPVRIRGRFCVFVLIQHGHNNKHDQERIRDNVYKQVHEHELVFVHVHTNKYNEMK